MDQLNQRRIFMLTFMQPLFTLRQESSKMRTDYFNLNIWLTENVLSRDRTKNIWILY